MPSIFDAIRKIHKKKESTKEVLRLDIHLDRTKLLCSEEKEIKRAIEMFYPKRRVISAKYLIRDVSPKGAYFVLELWLGKE